VAEQRPLRLWHEGTLPFRHERPNAAWSIVQKPVTAGGGGVAANPLLLVHLGDVPGMARVFVSNNNNANAAAVPIDIFGVHPEDPAGADFTTTLRQDATPLATVNVPAVADAFEPASAIVLPDGFHEFVIVPQATPAAIGAVVVVGFRAAMR